nr:glia maturation factor gamma isoform X5 [Mirounga angustirostris]
MRRKRLAQWRPSTNGSCCFDYCNLFIPQTSLDLVTKRSGGPHPEVKVDKDRQMVVLEEEFQNISPEELKTELPERQPRFVVYSYKYVHEDGRVSYPLCFIFSSPVGEARLSLSPQEGLRFCAWRMEERVRGCRLQA